MAEKGAIAGRGPIGIAVEAGKDDWWCACGKSKNQPFCDGSHKGSAFTPVKFEAKQTGKAWFCGCKQSANAPLCDGAHKRLP